MSGSNSIRTIWRDGPDRPINEEYIRTLAGEPLKEIDIQASGTAYEYWDNDGRYFRPEPRAVLTVRIRHIPTRIACEAVIKPQRVWTEKQLLHARRRVYDKVFTRLEEVVLEYLSKLD